MEELSKRTGYEFTIDRVSRVLCDEARKLQPGIVGAMHITCADESEYECVQAFQQEFVVHRLPGLKPGYPAAFRISNLGARYEEGAIGIVEHHFALPAGQTGFKSIIVKINSHVGVTAEKGGESYGYLDRYGKRSPCCGALDTLMAGKQGSFLDELRQRFHSQAKDRLQILMDVEKVAAEQRSLYAAIVSARLQARRVIKDIRNCTPSEPTLYHIVPCTTLNRSGTDTEILCGIYTADYRAGDANARVDYTGLGDDPSDYSFHIRDRRIYIQDKSGQASRTDS